MQRSDGDGRQFQHGALQAVVSDGFREGQRQRVQDGVRSDGRREGDSTRFIARHVDVAVTLDVVQSNFRLAASSRSKAVSEAARRSTKRVLPCRTTSWASVGRRAGRCAGCTRTRRSPSTSTSSIRYLNIPHLRPRLPNAFIMTLNSCCLILSTTRRYLRAEEVVFSSSVAINTRAVSSE